MAKISPLWAPKSKKGNNPTDHPVKGQLFALNPELWKCRKMIVKVVAGSIFFVVHVHLEDSG